MGIKSTVTIAVQTAFDGILSDAVKEFEYIKIDFPDFDPAYDPDDNADDDGSIHTVDKTRGVFLAPTTENVDGIVIDNLESVVIVLADELSLVPNSTGDMIENVEFGEMKVEKVITDPVGATHKLFVVNS